MDISKLKYYVIRDLQGNVLVTNPSRETREALQRVFKIIHFNPQSMSFFKIMFISKAVDFIEQTLNVKVIELKPKKLRLAFQIWSSMMNNGKPNQKAFSKLLTNSDQPINPYQEFLKSIFFCQKTHTLPALSLAITERLPSHDPKPFVDIGIQLRQELQDILGLV